MPEPEKSLEELLDAVGQGSEEAARNLIDQYGKHILYMVRQNLPRRLRTRFDSLDFVQDVWASFFADGPCRDDFSSPARLIGYLTRIARNKVVEEVRLRLVTRKYDMRLEKSLHATEGTGDSGTLVTRDPTPSQVMAGRELWDRLMQCELPADRVILHRLSEGKTQLEVAEELKISEKTVGRAVRRARRRLDLANPSANGA